MNEVTTRDWFAGMALKALIEQGMHVDHNYSTIAAVAYKMADSMMEKREQYAMPKQTYSLPDDVPDCGLGT